jgi:photosystem II stability/assembly factor-like uncharacterized protein
MTGHRDPIEDWLSRDVEVMPPPPGAFQRVRRRARRRKAIQAAGAAAGVAVIVAAGISVPALTGNLFQGPGTARVRNTAPAASPHPRPGLSGPALSTAGKGRAVPGGFRPFSVTFVGNDGGYLGAVLGQARCGGQLCTAMAGTASYGSSWTRVGAPPAALNSVSQVRFADAQNGWAYGPALYATHDGGQSWSQAGPGRGDRIIDLATIGGRVLAVAGTGCAGPVLSGCAGFALYAAATSGGTFKNVLTLPSGTSVQPGDLQLTTNRGYLITDGRLFAGSLDGAGWKQVPLSQNASARACLTNPASRAGGGPRLLAPGPTTLYLTCSSASRVDGKPSLKATERIALYESADGGKTWQPHGTIPAAGIATSLAVSPSGTLVLATTAGLYSSPDGRTWRRVATGSRADMGFRFVGMTTDRLGVAVPFMAAAGQLYVTTDGGTSWRPHTISP